MQKLLYILSQLNEDDVDWILTAGTQHDLDEGAVLVEEDGPIEALYIIVTGKLGISIPSQGICDLAVIGPGEVVGEISFADGLPPSATVTALSNVTAYAIPGEKLRDKLVRDTGFAARFYKAVTIFLSERYRGAVRRGPRSNYSNNGLPDARVLMDNVHLAEARLARLLNKLHQTGVVLLTGSDLTIEDVVDVAYMRRPVEVAPLAFHRVVAARRIVDTYVEQPTPVYGLTTGLGALKDTRISPAENNRFQENILKSHAAGIGPECSRHVVRAIMVARLNGMARGGAGVQPAVFSLLLEMLKRDMIPVVLSRGSIGMSDLAPMAHLSLPLIGLGEVDYQGRRMPSAEAFALAGLEPVQLGPKDGLSLVSSNAASIGHGALVLAESLDLLVYADIAAALSLEAFQGNISPLDERTHAVRPYAGQLMSAERLRNLLAGSSLWQGGATQSVQDPLSFRCTTQVHGACHDALAFARRTMEIELNSTGDNPIVLPEAGTIVSNGNFHTAGLAMSFDMLGIVMAQMTSLATSRVIKLNDPALSHLPAQLTPRPGINCGLGVIQKTVTALNAETRFLANPTSLDFMAVANSIEDHATNATISVNKASKMVENIRYVLAIELLTAAQGISLREGITLGVGTRAAYEAVRTVAPFVEDDTVLAPIIQAVYELLASGMLLTSVRQALSASAARAAMLNDVGVVE